MDLAITIFWIGVGLGALLVGIGVIMVALSLRPLARDTRALANDARRLTRLAEAELATVVGRTRDGSDGAEVATSDLADELHALQAQTDALEQRVLAAPRAALAASVGVASPYAEPEQDPLRRQPIGSVQSPHAREDEQIP